MCDKCDEKLTLRLREGFDPPAFLVPLVLLKTRFVLIINNEFDYNRLVSWCLSVSAMLVSAPQPSFPCLSCPPHTCTFRVVDRNLSLRLSSTGSADIYGHVDRRRCLTPRVGVHGRDSRVLPRWPSGQGQGDSRGPQASRPQTTRKVRR